MATRKCIRCKRGEAHEFRHGTLHSYAYHDCRCNDCKTAARATVQRWRAKHPEAQRGCHGSPEQRADYYRKNKAQYARNDLRTRAKFHRAVGDAQRKPWTPEEDAVVNDPKLTILEIAYMLKRNQGSIKYRRAVLRGTEAIGGR